MPVQQQTNAPRRRSSVAYDPARDIFKQLPETIPEDAITEAEDVPKQSAATSSSPLVDAEQTRKRRRSTSGDRQVKESNGAEAPNGPGSPNSKKPRSSPSPYEQRDQPKKPENNGTQGHKLPPRVPSDLPRIPRKPREDGEVSSSRPVSSAYSRRPDLDGRRDDRRRNGDSFRRRSRSPRRHGLPDAYKRRSPPRRPRSPSPIRDSPPREIIRPGGGRGRGRNVLAEQQRLAAEREAKQAAAPKRGVQEVSNQFYNARPEWVKERGRDWRRNESQIKGLRSFNNWIKSCIIHKFSPDEKAEVEELGWGEEAKEPEMQKPLLVLDIGCGKGGDLGKWQLAPQVVGLYVGLDPAETSINQARDRYQQMRRGRKPIFDAHFIPQDCFGAWIGQVPIVSEVGIDPNAGNGPTSRFSGGGFDVVTAMFTMHYAFESEEKVQMMLRNVAGSLKKGGRFIGVVPNSDVSAEHIREWHAKRAPPPSTEATTDVDKTADTEPTSTASNSNNDTSPSAKPKADGEGDDTDDGPSWGNSIYKVRFPLDPAQPLASDGSFRPPFAWKYTYWMAEAVDVPEFVVPWEAFRAMAEGFNLEQRYRKPFPAVFESERGNRELMQLAVRMGVTRYEGGETVLTDEEMEAVSFYHAFCFVKV
ncbi:hypothetical protein PV10_06630 [Exophiala mesophila]|uniref:mRNA cap guanine-N(7) methyltransferase n=1 Tax=Exophiala mesophila TaxID=212818 RepID=A0A0D1ZE02_EXOME|nr:uncharacterized protein PV10_06630 [Exophiala mesophila]KIV92169.1 hypothetical protein PV10_06630 [Exophiala mesophila]